MAFNNKQQPQQPQQQHPFNGPSSGTTQVSQNQKGRTNLDFNHASTPPLSFLQAGCPSCRPTNSIKALNAAIIKTKK